MFDIMMIRGVNESDSELRMTFDVPTSTRPEDLNVQVQDNLLQVACGPLTLTLPIHDVDLSKIQGILLSESGTLGVVAPKCRDDDTSGSDDSSKPVKVMVLQG